jgi:hypothetical protein
VRLLCLIASIMIITINVPRSFEKKLKALLARLEIPETEITSNFRDTVMANTSTDYNLWTDFYTYPNRATAERVANRILESGQAFVCLSYKSGRKTVQVTFCSENLRKSAEMFLRKEGIEVNASNVAFVTSSFATTGQFSVPGKRRAA